MKREFRKDRYNLTFSPILLNDTVLRRNQVAQQFPDARLAQVGTQSYHYQVIRGHYKYIMPIKKPLA